jgi:hypothetical protein
MARIRSISLILLCWLVVTSTAGCAKETTQNNNDPVNNQNSTLIQMPRPIVVDEHVQQGIKEEDIGVKLEFIAQTPKGLSFRISNNSGYDIKYGDGHSLYYRSGGYEGTSDNEFFILHSGKQQTIYTDIYEIGFGEFQFVKNIFIDPNNKTKAKEYIVVADFAIENTDIPQELITVTMEVDQDFASPMGVVINVTNGFADGLLYFDKSFWIQRNVNGKWEDVAPIASNAFLNDTNFLGSRQVSGDVIYWEWLYGELPPGEYRLGKSFLHRNEKGENTQYDLYSTFSLDGSPIPQDVDRGDDGLCTHPFYITSTIKAEVIKLYGPNENAIGSYDSGLRLRGLEGNLRYRIDDMYSVYNFFGLPVLDSNGNHIRFTDIEVGDVVEVTHCGVFLLSGVPILGCPYMIKVIE